MTRATCCAVCGPTPILIVGSVTADTGEEICVGCASWFMVVTSRAIWKAAVRALKTAARR